jgi:hypothetical protein
MILLFHSSVLVQEVTLILNFVQAHTLSIRFRSGELSGHWKLDVGPYRKPLGDHFGHVAWGSVLKKVVRSMLPHEKL